MIEWTVNAKIIFEKMGKTSQIIHIKKMPKYGLKKIAD